MIIIMDMWEQHTDFSVIGIVNITILHTHFKIC
jgi:hypothetical protein